MAFAYFKKLTLQGGGLGEALPQPELPAGKCLASDFAAAWTKVMQADRFDLNVQRAGGVIANR